MEELKLCPLKSNRTMCQRTDCAFWIQKPGNEGCAVAVLAEGMKEAVNELSYISANIP